jgi:WD40 repeat protein
MEPITLNRTCDFKLPTALLGASLLPDHGGLVAGCMDGVYLADLETKTFDRIGGHDSYVSSVGYLASQDAVVSAGYDGVVQWIDRKTKATLRQVKAHDFWSWDMAVSPDQSLIASVTGQYLAGGYKYEPAPEREPSVRLISTDSGEILHSLPHVPSVQAVTFSNDGRFVAAGNLMGEVRIWDSRSGERAGGFTTPDLTSWGIIKSHCYLGGIFALRFTPDDQHLIVCGMGEMRDPMAGNGRQLWQKWSWKDSDSQKIDETPAGQSGEGLMETLAFHPGGEYFGMGGRLRGGEWNVALFESSTGLRIGTLKSDYRVTELLFTPDGKRLIVVGTQGQPGRNQEGSFPPFGRVEIYDLITPSQA